MSRIQIPLRLAWAVTVHKSQGLTLLKVKLGPRKRKFASSLTFVCLSRVKTIDTLMIVGPFDFFRVQRLTGSNYQNRLDDFARRYI
jgi:ATP-dependent exoDNAse (exonuclease V) alpha subunit